ncbi:MAG TPA: RNA polymerase sigma factor [Methylomirabilota bacterium]|nr:RNA polymerase sigma factor [Methylomirabilota bacterium]
MTLPDTTADDQHDMARLVAGEDGALNDLMDRHGQPLFHYLIRVLRNDTDAAEVAQETFVRVYLHRDRFDVRRKFSTWMHTIATNLARDRQRYQARRPTVSINEPATDGQRVLAETLPAAGPDPVESLDAEERASLVRVAVEALPDELREPLLLSEYEDLSHAEIGIVLNCSAKAVEMRLYRARQQLRLSLAALLNSPEPRD